MNELSTLAPRPDQPPATGWGGRVADLLNATANPAGNISMSVSLNGANTFEIGNLGVSSAAAVPTITVSPTVGIVGVTPALPTMPPTVAAPSTASPTSTNLFPCLTGGLGSPGGSGC